MNRNSFQSRQDGPYQSLSSPKNDKSVFGGPPSRPSLVPPSAYQCGHVDFYGRDFIVTPDVLIPRPETEMMIDAVLNLMGKTYLPGVKPSEAQLADDVTVVDVGTGSGCIGITLKLEIPTTKIIATDISRDALSIARDNATKLGAEVEFMQSNLLENVNVEPDLIVANLPYVDRDWEWLDKEVLAAEPELALYAEDHGLTLIKKLLRQAAKQLIPYLMFEADPCQHTEIIAYAAKHRYSLVETRGFILVFNKS